MCLYVFTWVKFYSFMFPVLQANVQVLPKNKKINMFTNIKRLLLK